MPVALSVFGGVVLRGFSLVPGGLTQSLGAPETPRAEASRAAPAEHSPQGLGVSPGACGPACAPILS